MLKNCPYAIIFIGPPGSGKGTQASILRQKFNFFSFSTGNELRKEIDKKSVLGLKIKKIYDEGALVPDDIVVEMAKKVLEQEGINKVLFDGFPRTLEQAKSLSLFLECKNWFVRVFYFDLDTKVILDRIAGRFSCKICNQGYNEKTLKPKVDGVCDNCGGCEFVWRDDDKRETVLKRLDFYEKMTSPIVDYYKKKNIAYRVDASLSADQVSEKVIASVEEMLK